MSAQRGRAGMGAAMLTAAQVRRIDDSEVFTATRSPYLVVDDELCIRAVNTAYLRATGRSREALVGVPMFEAFPPNDADPADDGARRLAQSFAAVLSAGIRQHMGIQRYDIPVDHEPGEFVFKVWTPVNSPLRAGGRTVAVLHHVEDATVLISPPSDLPQPVSDTTGASSRPTAQAGDVWVRLVSALREACEDNARLRAKYEQLATTLDSEPDVGTAVAGLRSSTGASVDEAFRRLLRSVEVQIADSRDLMRVSRASVDRSRVLLHRYEAAAHALESAARREQAEIDREIRRSTRPRPRE